ncbi:unnamed protein product [Schistosoma turkestanicum]|nr:unnamed protein product [Schistosoma turkestanicum]
MSNYRLLKRLVHVGRGKLKKFEQQSPEWEFSFAIGTIVFPLVFGVSFAPCRNIDPPSLEHCESNKYLYIVFSNKEDFDFHFPSLLLTVPVTCMSDLNIMK